MLYFQRFEDYCSNYESLGNSVAYINREGAGIELYIIMNFMLSISSDLKIWDAPGQFINKPIKNQAKNFLE